MKLRSISNRVAGRRLLPLFAVCVLLLSAPAVAGLRGQSSALPYGLVLPSGYFQYYQIQTVSSTSTVTFTVSSNTSLSTAFMTNSQLISFNDSQSELSDSIYLQNASSVQETLNEPIGSYYLVFYAYGNTANVTYNLESSPVDPYYYVPLTPPQPTGVASFGLYNVSGNAVPYQVETSEVVGVANIAALQAYNASAASDESNLSGATLQLNTILMVNEQGGQQQVYWAQNTPDFVTAVNQLAYGDNIWNFSVSGVFQQHHHVSRGRHRLPQHGIYGRLLQRGRFQIDLSASLWFSLFWSTRPSFQDRGSWWVWERSCSRTALGPRPRSTGSTARRFMTLRCRARTSWSRATRPLLTVCTTTLNWSSAGENNGEATDFTQMSASLGLFYLERPAALLNSFPSLYSFRRRYCRGGRQPPDIILRQRLRAGYYRDTRLRVPRKCYGLAVASTFAFRDHDFQHIQLLFCGDHRRHRHISRDLAIRFSDSDLIHQHDPIEHFDISLRILPLHNAPRHFRSNGGSRAGFPHPVRRRPLTSV